MSISKVSFVCFSLVFDCSGIPFTKAWNTSNSRFLKIVYSYRVWTHGHIQRRHHHREMIIRLPARAFHNSTSFFFFSSSSFSFQLLYSLERAERSDNYNVQVSRAHSTCPPKLPRILCIYRRDAACICVGVPLDWNLLLSLLSIAMINVA